MCDPATIAGLALSVGGGVVQGQNQAAYVDAVNQANKDAYAVSQRAREDERARQNDFETRQVRKVDETTEAFTRENFDAQRAKAAEDFTNFLGGQSQAMTPADLLPAAPSGSDAVDDDARRVAAKTAGEMRDRIKALASASGYGGASGARGRTFGDAADFVSTLGGLRRGSLAVGQQEQTVPAAVVTPGDSTFADILSGVGGMLAFGGPGLFGGGASALPAGVSPATSIRPRPRPNLIYGG